MTLTTSIRAILASVEGTNPGFSAQGCELANYANKVPVVSVDAIPDETPWRASIAYLERIGRDDMRQRWADAAERHQVAEKGWREAEWLAFLEIAQELPTEAESPIWTMTVRHRSGRPS